MIMNLERLLLRCLGINISYEPEKPKEDLHPRIRTFEGKLRQKLHDWEFIVPRTSTYGRELPEEILHLPIFLGNGENVGIIEYYNFGTNYKAINNILVRDSNGRLSGLIAECLTESGARPQLIQTTPRTMGLFNMEAYYPVFNLIEGLPLKS